MGSVCASKLAKEKKNKNQNSAGRVNVNNLRLDSNSNNANFDARIINQQNKSNSVVRNNLVVANANQRSRSQNLQNSPNLQISQNLLPESPLNIPVLNYRAQSNQMTSLNNPYVNSENIISDQINAQITYEIDPRINLPGELPSNTGNQNDNHNNSINEEFTSRRNQLSVTNPMNLYPSSSGLVILSGSEENQPHLCTLCNTSFRSNREYRQHVPFCNEARERVMHSSLNEILNLVQSLNRQLQGEAPLNLLNFLGMDELEENLEYIDWEFSHSEDGGVIWKNCGKVKLSKEEINKIASKTFSRIREDKYYAKRIWMYKFINKHFYDKTGSNTTLVVSREYILEESFNQFMTTKELDLKRAMQIFFVDEVAHDVGGVYREWYTALFDAIFKEGFFCEVTSAGPGRNTFFIPSKKCTENVLQYYEFIGKVLGKAIFDKITLKTNFNFVLLKHLMRLNVTIEDMRYVDLEYYNTLRSLIENKIDDNSGLYFTWNIRNDEDQLEEVELVPNGRKIPLKEDNKLLFVLKVVNFVCYESIRPKIDAIVKGFYSIMSNDIVRIFSLEEFDFLISGQNTIDLDDWKANTIYKGLYSASHNTIKLFWSTLSELSSDKLLRFYKFCTGCSRVPIDGFNSLQGTRNKYQKFCIESPAFSGERKMRLIEANTCFNRIYLPQYDTEEEMRRVIWTIVENDTNFFGKQ